MSSTDHYTDVIGEESGLVPPQPTPEWPKKIRTLTAAELDRLTIDESGRFYWDGRAVQGPGAPPEERRSNDELDHSALDLIDRAALELYPRGDGRPTEPARRSEENKDNALDLDSIASPTVAPAAMPVAVRSPAERAPDLIAAPAVFHSVDRTRVALTGWQKAGVAIVVVSLLIGAVSIAALSWITAHDWGCRAGVFRSYCPASPAQKEPARTDIPA